MPGRQPRRRGCGAGAEVHADARLVEQSDDFVEPREVDGPVGRLQFRPAEDVHGDQSHADIAHQGDVLAPHSRVPLLGVVVAAEVDAEVFVAGSIDRLLCRGERAVHWAPDVNAGEYVHVHSFRRRRSSLSFCERTQSGTARLPLSSAQGDTVGACRPRPDVRSGPPCTTSPSSRAFRAARSAGTSTAIRTSRHPPAKPSRRRSPKSVTCPTPRRATSSCSGRSRWPSSSMSRTRCSSKTPTSAGSCSVPMRRSPRPTTRWSVLIVDSERDTDRVARYLSGGSVDGAIIVSARAHDPVARVVERLRLPAAFVGHPPGASSAAFVVIDNRGSARAITERLIATGRSRVGMIAAALDRDSGSERLAGFADALGDRFDERLVESIPLYSYSAGQGRDERAARARSRHRRRLRRIRRRGGGRHGGAAGGWPERTRGRRRGRV